ncbi:MAG: hypothetical protein JRJ03_19640 [Deltaproteobacteria bacterium]|nr:hypothetical protein [Deltaproteobacteria bacterium]
MKARQFELRVFKRKYDDMGLAFGEVSSEQERKDGQREEKENRIWGTLQRS